MQGLWQGKWQSCPREWRRCRLSWWVQGNPKLYVWNRSVLIVLIPSHVIGEDVISNFAGAAATLTAQIGAFVQLIGAFVIGLLLVLTMWTCLLCCCCCPSCCPSKCCQKNETEPYTKCELYWPTIVLILALILTLVGGAMGLSRASGFQDSTASTLCSTAILFDDMINGNVTDEGNFFIGIRTLAN